MAPAPAGALDGTHPTGLTLFAGQFLFQFFGIAHGMPPGLASVIVQIVLPLERLARPGAAAQVLPAR